MNPEDITAALTGNKGKQLELFNLMSAAWPQVGR